MWKLSLVLLLLALAFRQSAATCGVCNSENGAACIGPSEFQLCYGTSNTPNTNQTFTCPKAGDICTLFGQICVSAEDTNLAADCDGSTSCNNCTDKSGFEFVCTGPDTYTRCAGDGSLSTETGICPPGYSCDPTHDDIPCQDSCALEAANIPTCEGVVVPTDPPVTEPPVTQAPVTQPPVTQAPVTQPPATQPPVTQPPVTQPPVTQPPVTQPPVTQPPVTQPPGTPGPPTQPDADAVCAAQQFIGRYPYPNDTGCKYYVNCYMQSGVIKASALSCPTGRSFNKQTQTCEATPPAGCPAT